MFYFFLNIFKAVLNNGKVKNYSSIKIIQYSLILILKLMTTMVVKNQTTLFLLVILSCIIVWNKLIKL